MGDERDQHGTASSGEAALEQAPTEPAKRPAEAKPAKPRPHRNPALLRAFRSGRPVRGTVVAVIKGGYEVKVERSRGFCPHSQIALHRENEPERQVGQTYMFRVTQVRRGGEDVVLSRRALLEEERAEEAKAVRATLVEGAVMQGHVASIAEFGAFVDLGAGVLGLAHLTELAHDRVIRVADVVQLGQTVQVKVLKIDEQRGRISLSLRQATPDPWQDVASRYTPGASYPGTVRRIADFGAFVELERGLEALAPASEFPPAAQGWSAGLEAGQGREWIVLAVDPKARRISLALPGTGTAAVAIEAGAEIGGIVQRVERFGVFVWLGPGKVGLMPRDWTGLSREVDLPRRFAVGQPVEVRVVEVTDGGRKIRLARKGFEVQVEPPPEKAKPERQREPEPAQAPQQSGSFGTLLGDKLRAVLAKKPPTSGS